MLVLRNSKTSEVTHISIQTINGVQYYLSKKDYDFFLYHEVTEDEVHAFFGECDYPAEIAGIANGEFSIDVLKYDIMKYNKLFKDPVIKK